MADKITYVYDSDDGKNYPIANMTDAEYAAYSAFPNLILSDGPVTSLSDIPASATASADATAATPTPTPAAASTSGSVTTPSSTASGLTSTGSASDVVDNRLRISALSGRETQVYGANDAANNILTPLYATGGLMFPYTPTIQVAGDTDWTPHALTHTNYDIYSYQRTPSATISLTGKFTVQNQREGEYALACIHFLRTVGKMYYGEQDSSSYNPVAATTTTPTTKATTSDATSTAAATAQYNAGLPPPVLRLRGYGLYMFSDLRCVLKGYNFSFEENMDLITIQTSSGADIMLPPMFTLTVSLLLQQNPQNLRKNFKLDDFRTGKLMRQVGSNGGWF